MHQIEIRPCKPAWLFGYALFLPMSDLVRYFTRKPTKGSDRDIWFRHRGKLFDSKHALWRPTLPETCYTYDRRHCPTVSETNTSKYSQMLQAQIPMNIKSPNQKDQLGHMQYGAEVFLVFAVNPFHPSPTILVWLLRISRIVESRDNQMVGMSGEAYHGWACVTRVLP